jgi:EAL domain-containing protein (putative c-di-GMP-specific phosphodiesterase class I)
MHDRLQFENALRSATDRDELHLAYQPIVSLGDGRMQSCEALLRWDHPGLGPVSPAEFIPVAEESGAILEIGAWVLGEACRQAADWRSELGKAAPLPVHINVSPRQLAQIDFPQVVGRTLAETGVRPQDVALEITESALLTNPEVAAETLERLRSMGTAVVLDDFGTGASSLSHLKAFPIDTVKVDRLFVSHLTTEPKDAAIVAAVIAMAEAFGLEVVAEGIETPEQVSRLVGLGCRLGQGFHFARPMAPDVLVSAGKGPGRLRIVA